MILLDVVNNHIRDQFCFSFVLATMISMRLFIARCCGELLFAIGRYSAYPVAEILSGGKPFFSTKYRTTSVALLTESSQFDLNSFVLIGTLSVAFNPDMIFNVFDDRHNPVKGIFCPIFKFCLAFIKERLVKHSYYNSPFVRKN